MVNENEKNNFISVSQVFALSKNYILFRPIQATVHAFRIPRPSKQCRLFRRPFGHDSAAGLSTLVVLLSNYMHIAHNWSEKGINGEPF